MSALLSTAYMPPVPYFTAMVALSNSSTMPEAINEKVYLEACENYQKQSWRNRCRILTSNGPEDLSFPIIHEGGTHSIPVREIKIDYSTPWVRSHERAITSAYGTSAFFEYYRDPLFAILENGLPTLWELNTALLRFLITKLGLSVEIHETSDFLHSDSEAESGIWKGFPLVSCIDAVDLREVIHPKRPDDIMHRLSMEKPYFQVFSQKYGFTGNLSVIDLLFNEGPNAISFVLPRI